MKAITQVLMATGLMVTATAASAHAGHDAGTGFASGLLHPMIGLDHLLAMAAIGFWSVRQSPTLKNGTPPVRDRRHDPRRCHCLRWHEPARR